MYFITLYTIKEFSISGNFHPCQCAFIGACLFIMSNAVDNDSPLCFTVIQYQNQYLCNGIWDCHMHSWL